MKIEMVVEILGRSGHWWCCYCCYCSDRRGGRRVGPGSCWGFGSGFCPPGIKLLDAWTRTFGGGGTYHCMNFIHDGAFGGFDGTSRTDETDVTFNVAAVGLGDVDFAPGGLLHVFDRFAAC